MPGFVGRALALGLLLITVPAFAQLTDEQLRLIKQLPSPERVVAAVPPRADDFETKVVQLSILYEFHELAESIATTRIPPEWRSTMNQYWRAYSEMKREVLEEMGAWGKGEKELQAAESRIVEVGRGIFRTPREAFKYRRKIFEAVLEGELSRYALSRHDNQPEVRQAIGLPTAGWLGDAPPVLVKVVDTVLSLPASFWTAFLVVWLILGIAFRTTPFHLLPDDVWTLQRGRKRLRMQYCVGTVIQVRETVEQITHERRPVNEYGIPNGPAQVSVTRNLHVKLFIRSRDGEHTVTLTNRNFDVREGHRILEVWDAKSRTYLFLYNYDLRQYVSMGSIRRYVKMRPRILIPVWLLASYATYTLSPDPMKYLPYVFYGTPVVYLIFMGILNHRRALKFLNVMAPKMVAATSATSAPGYIGNSEYGIAQA